MNDISIRKIKNDLFSEGGVTYMESMARELTMC